MGVVAPHAKKDGTHETGWSESASIYLDTPKRSMCFDKADVEVSDACAFDAVVMYSVFHPVPSMSDMLECTSPFTLRALMSDFVRGRC